MLEYQKKTSKTRLFVLKILILFRYRILLFSHCTL